jgi:hypothetical protein
MKFGVMIGGTHAHVGASFALALLVLIVTGGCETPSKAIPRNPVSMRSAIETVNTNTSAIQGTLRASGFVDGTSTRSDGKKMDYHLDGVLFYLRPTYVRFDLKSFGDRKFLLGSNAESFWVFDKAEERYHCARHGEESELADALPIPPDRVVDALGLSLIDLDADDERTLGHVQRIVSDFQQVLFLERDSDGLAALRKEYWLDRYSPYLIRRVIFRDVQGDVEMVSELGDYQPIASGGPLLPHSMKAEWPRRGSQMRFRVSNWRIIPGLGPDALQFQPPSACRNP